MSESVVNMFPLQLLSFQYLSLFPANGFGFLLNANNQINTLSSILFSEMNGLVITLSLIIFLTLCNIVSVLILV